MRGTSFLQLITDLRAELRRSTSSAVGVEDLDNLKAVLNRVYEMLWNEYDWPFLRRVFPRITLQSGQQYYDFPEDLDIDRVERVAVWWGNIPHIVQRGISFEEYAGFNSTLGYTSEPMLRWDVRDVDGATQFEVWPLPNSNAQQVEFIGIRNIAKLVDDADICLLDDHLVILFAAAELLAAQKSSDAQQKMQAAQSYFAKLKARAKGASREYRVGVPDKDHGVLSGRAIVRVR